MSASETVRQKAVVEVIIDGHYNSKVYTSGSPIVGRAIVKPLRDVSFSVLEILFLGTAATRLDFVQQFPVHSARNFLKLRMPLSESNVPQDRIFRQGHTYTLPFNFVVPHELPYGACTHDCNSLAVTCEHLRMPPTMGFWEDNDQSPDMTNIKYCVKARAFDTTGKEPVKVFESQHVVKVLPARPEDAPLDISFRDERYQLSKTKGIRKNLFGAKAGKVTASATQPAAVILSADGQTSSPSGARINLEFQPNSAETAPPKLNGVSVKLLAVTHFSPSSIEELPNMGPRASHLHSPTLSYTTTTTLVAKHTEKADWRQQHVSSQRRDSGYLSGHLTEDASADDADTPPCAVKHVATLDVPFSLPTNASSKKIFLPTFHSCLISRTYVLQVSVAVGAANTTLQLALPLQIGVETVHEAGDAELPSFEAAMGLDVDADLQPRLLRAMPAELHMTSVLPGYNEYRGGIVGVGA